MGKKNNWEDPPMIIRLIGESWWKDETTQKKKCLVLDLCTCSFNKNSYEQFDTENFHDQAKRFGFSRIMMNEGNHEELNKKEKKKLRDLGITFLWQM